MGRTARRKYIEVPKDYWVSSIKVEWVTKENNAKKD